MKQKQKKRDAHSGFIPPKQERSEEAVKIILETATRLIQDRTFDNISINEFIKASGMSPGRFYGRFSGKKALFQALLKEYEEDAWHNLLVAAENLKSSTLPERIEEFAKYMVHHYQRDKAIIKSMVFHNPDANEENFSSLTREFGSSHVDKIAAILAKDDPKQINGAIKALSYGLSLCREIIALNNSKTLGLININHKEFGQDLARMMNAIALI